MPDVTFNAIVSAVQSDANFDATVISTNFQNIADVVNSNNLDSVNYSLSSANTGSGFLSQHFGVFQVLSQHITTDAIRSDIISNTRTAFPIQGFGIVNSHLEFANTTDCVRILQFGIRADKLQEARISKAFTVASTVVSFTDSVAFSDAIEGNPAYTASPVIQRTAIVQSAGAIASKRGMSFYNISSTGMSYFVYLASGASHSATVHLNVIGK